MRHFITFLQSIKESDTLLVESIINAYTVIFETGTHRLNEIKEAEAEDASIDYQTEYFTCGPASLINAMKQIDPSYETSDLEEYIIWKKANTVFMGDQGGEYPGTSPFGLGSYAIEKGYKATVVINENVDGIEVLTNTNKDDGYHKKIYDEMEHIMCDEFEAQGGSLVMFDVTLKDLKNIDFTQNAVIALIHLKEGMLYGHWVCTNDVLDDRIIYFDPYYNEKSEDGIHEVTFEYFENNCWSFDKDEKRACIIIGR